MQSTPPSPASPPAPSAPRELSRLAALLRYEILDTPEEDQFDDFTVLAARLCGTPIALISLVDERRQWFKSRVGLGVSETPREISFCTHTIAGSGIFEVADAQQDPRFADNPLVTGEPHIRFYAGAPLNTPDGYQLGTLCVIDRQPRQLDAEQRDTLARLSRQVMRLFERACWHTGTPNRPRCSRRCSTAPPRRCWSPMSTAISPASPPPPSGCSASASRSCSASR